MYLNRAEKTAFQDSANDDYASLLRQEEMPANVWGVDFQTNLTLGESTGLTLGAAYKRASWDYDDIYTSGTRTVGATGKQQSVSPFANLNLRFPEKHVIITLGARYDWIKTSDGANWDSQGSAGKPAYDNNFDTGSEGSLSPEAGISWHLDDKTTIRASGGKGSVLPAYSNFTRSMSGVGEPITGKPIPTLTRKRSGPMTSESNGSSPTPCGAG